MKLATIGSKRLTYSIRAVATISALLCLPSLIGIVYSATFLIGGIWNLGSVNFLAFGALLYIFSGWYLAWCYVLVVRKGEERRDTNFWIASLVYNIFVLLMCLAIIIDSAFPFAPTVLAIWTCFVGFVSYHMVRRARWRAAGGEASISPNG
jgi:hypothetical protein